MRRLLICIAMSLMAICDIETAVGAEPPDLRLPILQAAKRQAIERGLRPKGGTTCVPSQIDLNSTVHAALQTTDCALDDGTFADYWIFDGTTGDEVTIDMVSDYFDTVVFLVDPTPAIATFDDDGGFGTNSRIVFTLYETGQWSIAANNFFAVPGDPGGYTLTLISSAVVFKDGFESGDTSVWSATAPP